MSNVFNFSRFGKYFIYDLRNLIARYGVSLLVLGLLPLAWYIVTVVPSSIFSGVSLPSFGTRIGLFWVTTMITFIIFPSRVYGRLTNKEDGSDWLLIPASRLEKFLSMLIVCLVVVPLAFLAMYSLTDWLLSLADPRYGQALATYNVNEVMFSPEDEEYIRLTGRGFWAVWLGLIPVIMIMLLGALVWKKGKVGKTILVLMGIGIVFSLIGVAVANGVNFDFPSEKLEALAYHVNNHAQLYLNLLVWLHTGFWAILSGTGIWFALKNLKH